MFPFLCGSPQPANVFCSFQPPDAERSVFLLLFLCFINSFFTRAKKIKKTPGGVPIFILLAGYPCASLSLCWLCPLRDRANSLVLYHANNTTKQTTKTTSTASTQPVVSSRCHSRDLTRTLYSTCEPPPPNFLPPSTPFSLYRCGLVKGGRSFTGHEGQRQTTQCVTEARVTPKQRGKWWILPFNESPHCACHCPPRPSAS